MRLCEAFTKVFYSRAIDLGCTKQLSQAFEALLKLRNRFEQVLAHTSNGTKVWKRLSLQGYECKAFSEMLPATDKFPNESAIERVLRTVWPPRDVSISALPPNRSVSAAQPPPPTPPLPRSGVGRGGQAKAPAGKAKNNRAKQTPAAASVANDSNASAASAADGGAGSASKQSKRKSNPVREETAEQANRFIELSCFLFRLFHVVTFQLRCKDPTNTTLNDFGINCRNFGARWCMFMPRNRCTSLYLHTVMMHGGTFMKYVLQFGITVGMLENSGAERRHQIGKLQFRKTLCGGGLLYFMACAGNKCAYLTLRGLLIWQYGRDMLAYFEAVERKMDEMRKQTNGQRRNGWAIASEDNVREEGDILRTIESFRAGVNKRIVDKDASEEFSEALTDQVLMRLENVDDSEEAPDLIEVTGLGPTDGIEWSEWQQQNQPSAALDLVSMAVSPAAGDQTSDASWMNRLRPSMRGGNNSGLVDPTQPIVRSDGTYVEDIQGGIGDDMESDHAGSENRSVLGDDSCSEEDGDEYESAGLSDSDGDS